MHVSAPPLKSLDLASSVYAKFQLENNAAAMIHCSPSEVTIGENRPQQKLLVLLVFSSEKLLLVLCLISLLSPPTDHALLSSISSSKPSSLIEPDEVLCFCSSSTATHRFISKMLPLKDIAPAAQNNIDTQFILLEKGMVKLEGQVKTCLTLVADETAAAHFQLWGDECDAFNPGDILCLSKGIFSYNRNSLVLRAGKKGSIQKVGEFTMAYAETPNMSEIKWAPNPNNPRIYVQEAMISPYSRVFPPIK
ncbi:hypothetical protein SAY87_017522 [Trapa incisa]|uniref:SOSS complex subunit B homolog n=1 Tax=Trapa incisa TaxID=236973 RepID=A0AAN7QV93_9MYRT|nr:hypothetical protein SAY87_017522 [Trapa incisa]